MLNNDENIEHVVLLIHGIRTHASWAEMVASVIEKSTSIKVVPVKYGYFDTFKFLSPILTRDKPVKRIIREIRDVRQRFPNSKISVIAHSFGTYALSKALDEPDIKLNKIILCGSIIADDFRIARFRSQLDHEPILNDCGTHDIWPVLAKSATWGYGATGTFGFGTLSIRDRFHKFTHSDYFSRDFVTNYWLPFIVDGEIKRTEWEEIRTNPPWWQSLLSISQLRLVIIGLFVYLLYLGINHYNLQKISQIKIHSPAYIGHIIGASELGLNIEILNQKSNDAIFSKLYGEIISPKGEITKLQYINNMLNGHAAPPIYQYVLKENENQKFTISLRSETIDQVTSLNEIVMRQLEKNPPPVTQPWKARTKVFSDELADALMKMALDKFSWAPGKWTLKFHYTLNNKRTTQELNFEISNYQIKAIKAAIPYYSSGLGVISPWLYGSPSKIPTFQSVDINLIK